MCTAGVSHWRRQMRECTSHETFLEGVQRNWTALTPDSQLNEHDPDQSTQSQRHQHDLTDQLLQNLTAVHQIAFKRFQDTIIEHVQQGFADVNSHLQLAIWQVVDDDLANATGKSPGSL